MIIASSILSLFVALDAQGIAQLPEELPVEQVVESPENTSTTLPTEFDGEALLSKINSRMEEAKTARGGFKQIDAMGEVTTGDFFIRRPGRIRFEYNAPAPYLIVSDGTTVAIEDKELETIDRAPLSATPLKHFLKKKLDLANDTKILDAKTLPEFHLIVIEDNPQNGEDALDGVMFLKFDLNTYDLIGWVTYDGLGNETRVDLIDMEMNVKISPRLFVLEEDDDRDRR
ncbi:LolA family protein [Hirschia maritima]|uniref:LolA family protein n=1 Tax=Hirschia maritima TaxID=1121961 RepID=UPI00036E208B|nr:outer membrane lipoprotein carrier protein LolA [Hirschia maritima]